MASIHGAYGVHGFKVQLMELSAAIKDDKAATLRTWPGNRKSRYALEMWTVLPWEKAKGFGFGEQNELQLGACWAWGATWRTCNKKYGDTYKHNRTLDQLNLKRSMVSEYQSRLNY